MHTRDVRIRLSMNMKVIRHVDITCNVIAYHYELDTHNIYAGFCGRVGLHTCFVYTTFDIDMIGIHHLHILDVIPLAYAGHEAEKHRVHTRDVLICAYIVYDA